jgi:hypothetical protein
MNVVSENGNGMNVADASERFLALQAQVTHRHANLSFDLRKKVSRQRWCSMLLHDMTYAAV